MVCIAWYKHFNLIAILKIVRHTYLAYLITNFSKSGMHTGYRCTGYLHVSPYRALPEPYQALCIPSPTEP